MEAKSGTSFKFLFKITLVIILSLNLSACGIFKKKIKPETDKNMSIQNFRNELKRARFDQSYVKAKMDIDFKGMGQNLSLTGHLKMIKDSALLITFTKFGFPVAKMLVTPQEVAFYETITRSYYRETPEAISQKTGIPFQFDQLQSLFTGDAYPLLKESNDWEFNRNSDGSYLLTGNVSSNIKEMKINSLLKIAEIFMTYDGKNAQAVYRDYQNGFPGKILLKTPEAQAEIKMKKIKTGEAFEIRFHIPDGYTRKHF